ncbi:MAG: hypothetical protein ACM3QU_15075 [Verrucomicrobiota bacterium]
MGQNDGRHDFDFLFGAWRIENRKRVNMLVPGDDEWVEFDATSEARPVLGGIGNVDTYHAPGFPGRPGFEGVTLRLFEPKTGLWRIWWASTAASGGLDEPVVGRFEDDGIGRFECDDIIDGIHLRVRCEWTVVDDDTLRWEQLCSFDGRRTWESNWVMESTRIASAVSPAAAVLSPV